MSSKVVVQYLLLNVLCLSFASEVVASPGGQKQFIAHDRSARGMVSKMTLDEKIGQMTQVDHRSLKRIEDIERYHLGSMLSGGDSDPEAGTELKNWSEIAESYQARARKTRLAIPLLYGIDAVHGHNNVQGATIFPHNIGLGATRNPKLVEAAARVTADELRATGIAWTFAPMIGIPRDERWGRNYEGFGEDSALVTELGAAAVRGLQGEKLQASTSVLGCAKHFVGDGGTTWGTALPPGKTERFGLDRGDLRVSEEEIRRVLLPPYIAAIQAGVGTIMPSYNSWNGMKCSGSKRLLTEILKKELGFEGFLISDWAALKELPGDRKTQIITAVNAGMDMVMVPDEYPEFQQALREAIQERKIPLSRINDAVKRILRVKFALGLMKNAAKQQRDPDAVARFGSSAHREVARQAVRESLVLLKNENQALPLSKALRRIHVAGRSADDIGNQCGGWTIAWQGKSGETVRGGTTLLKAIQKAVSGNTEVTYSKDGAGAEGASVGIAVIGETPYAEWLGDRPELSLSAEDVSVIEKMRAAGVPVVTVLISGRALLISEALEKSQAFIAAWLPGTEGQGVADILFGDFRPTGKLPVSWPRSMDQIPINREDAVYQPLFPYGYGLSY